MKRAPLRCPSCRGLNVRTVETRADNDGRLATVWRVRWCEDCGQQQGSAEVRVDMRDVRAALARLARDRRTFA
jgi:transcriptional regulator NrdR family protein